MEWEAKITKEEAEEILAARQKEIEEKLSVVTKALRDEIQIRENETTKTHLGDCCCNRPSINGNRVASLEKCLIKINEAWQRIKDNSYGTCPNCEQSIPAGRLESIPEVKLCITCKKNLKNILFNDRVGAMSRELAH